MCPLKLLRIALNGAVDVFLRHGPRWATIGLLFWKQHRWRFANKVTGLSKEHLVRPLVALHQNALVEDKNGIVGFGEQQAEFLLTVFNRLLGPNACRNVAHARNHHILAKVGAFAQAYFVYVNLV